MRPADLRKAFVVLCLVGLLAYLSYNMIRTPVLPLFAQELGAGAKLIGLVVAASTITGIFVKLPSGILAEVIGSERVLRAALVVFGVVPFAYLFVRRVAVLILLRFVHGLGTALFAPVAMTVVARLFPAQRGEFLGWYFSSTQVGKLVGPILGGFFLGLFGYDHTFLICGAIGLSGLVLMAVYPVLLRHPDFPAPFGSLNVGHFMGEFQQVIRDLRVLVTSGMEALQMLASGALMAFLPIYGVQAGLSPAQVGFLFGVQGVSALVGKPLVGRLSDRIGRRNLVAAGLGVCAISFGGISLAQDFLPFLGLTATFGLGEAIVVTCTSALVADLWQTRSLGSAMGAYGMVMDIGHASGPLLMGLLVSGLGFSGAFWTIGLILMAGAVLFLSVIRR